MEFFCNSNHPFSHILSGPLWIYMDSNKNSTREAIPSIHKKPTMTRSFRHLRLGAQANCSILLSKLHLSAVVDAHFPNCELQKRLKDLIAVRIDDATHGGCTTKSVFFTLPSIPKKSFIAQRNFALSLGTDPKIHFLR